MKSLKLSAGLLSILVSFAAHAQKVISDDYKTTTLTKTNSFQPSQGNPYSHFVGTDWHELDGNYTVKVTFTDTYNPKLISKHVEKIIPRNDETGEEFSDEAHCALTAKFDIGQIKIDVLSSDKTLGTTTSIFSTEGEYRYPVEDGKCKDVPPGPMTVNTISKDFYDVVFTSESGKKIKASFQVRGDLEIKWKDQVQLFDTVTDEFDFNAAEWFANVANPTHDSLKTRGHMSLWTPEELKAIADENAKYENRD